MWSRIAARRADNHVGPFGELVDLPADRLAAVDGHRMDAPPMRELEHFAFHLHGQLTRRNEHQRLRTVYVAPRRQAFQDGNDEGRRLAGAGVRLTQDIHPGQRAGNQSGLDFRGLQIAGLLQGLHHRGGEAQIFKTGSGGTGGNGGRNFL